MSTALTIETQSKNPDPVAPPNPEAPLNPNAVLNGSAKVDTTVIDNAPKPESGPVKPAGVPDKFWKDGVVDYDGLLKSYTELEKKIGAATPPTAAPTAAPTATPTAAPTADPSDPTGGKVDIAPFAAEYETTGKLSEDSYAKLAAAGFPKQIVDGYVQGQVALREQFANQLIDEAGGKEMYTAKCKAAGALWSPEEIAAFEQAVSGTPEQARQAVQKLNTWHEAQFGRSDNRIEPTNDLGGGMGGGYTSLDECQLDMRKPEYAKSQAFRDEVERKVALYLQRNRN